MSSEIILETAHIAKYILVLLRNSESMWAQTQNFECEERPLLSLPFG